VEVLILRRALQSPAFPVLLILVLLAAVAQPVWAHAVLMQSKPAINATVKGPDVPIWLRYNVRVDGKRSHLQLIAPDGSTISVDSPKQTAPDILESSVSGLKPGAYKLQWRVLASDGHMSSGVVEFTVN
jgi:methionine-rich copper-binding protein CopC